MSMMTKQIWISTQNCIADSSVWLFKRI